MQGLIRLFRGKAASFQVSRSIVVLLISLALTMSGCGPLASLIPTASGKQAELAATDASSGQIRSVTIAYTGFGQGLVVPSTVICSCGGEIVSSEGGLARRATYLTQLRRKNPQLVLVDTGGTLVEATGSGLNTDKLLIKAMSEMGYEALNAGQGELLAGRGVLGQFAETPGFTLIASLPGGGGGPGAGTSDAALAKPYVVRPVSGIRIGIVGITSLPSSARTADSTSRMPPAEAIRPLLEEVRKQSDLIVVLADLEPAEVQALARADLGVQVILGSRSMTPREATRDGSVITASAGGEGLYVGNLSLALDDHGQVVSFQGQTMVLDDSFQEDPNMVKLRDQYQ